MTETIESKVACCRCVAQLKRSEQAAIIISRYSTCTVFSQYELEDMCTEAKNSLGADVLLELIGTGSLLAILQRMTYGSCYNFTAFLKLWSIKF